MTTISFVGAIPEDCEAKMREGFVAYETSHGIDINYRQFALIMTNENNETIGVLNAYTVFCEIYVDDLWVDDQYRHKGYGTQLLSALEDQFKGQGFNNISLVTSAFQAPEFYKKCGFTLEFKRENVKNPKLTKFFFIKYFNDDLQTQGLKL